MEVRYTTPDEKGENRRQRNARFAAAADQPDPTPEIDVPAEGSHLWEWFWTLSRRRRGGPEAITYSEVADWQRLTGTAVRPEEIQVLMRMDDAFLSQVGEERREAEARAAAKRERT